MMNYSQSAGRWEGKNIRETIYEQTCLDSFFFLCSYTPRPFKERREYCNSIGHRWQSRCCLSPQGHSSSLTRNKIWRAQLSLEWIPLRRAHEKKEDYVRWHMSCHAIVRWYMLVDMIVILKCQRGPVRSYFKIARIRCVVLLGDGTLC